MKIKKGLYFCECGKQLTRKMGTRETIFRSQRTGNKLTHNVDELICLDCAKKNKGDGLYETRTGNRSE